MDHFSYHSEQVHSFYENGKGQTRRNVVNIKGGKGTKAVETYAVNGTLKSRKEKTLTPTELDCIKKNQFVPGLFKDCVRPFKNNSTRKARPKRKQTRRNK